MRRLSECWEPNVGRLEEKQALLATERLSNVSGMFSCSLPVWSLKVDAPLVLIISRALPQLFMWLQYTPTAVLISKLVPPERLYLFITHWKLPTLV